MSSTTSSALSLGTDPIGKLLLKYSIPAIIAMASASLYNIIDSIFVGHGVGGAAIAGMAITMPIMNIAAAFGAMVGVGAGARISIRLGEGNKTAAEKVLGNAVLLNIIIGSIVMITMLVFMNPILMLFSGGKATVQTISYAREFMTIIMSGNIITHLYLGMNDMMRASGYPKKAMIAMLTSVFMNLILNPLFIFRFGWGIRGSAAATVISQCIAFSIGLHHFCSSSSYIHFKLPAFHVDWRIVTSILSIGLAPFLLNTCASAVAAFVNNALLKEGGTYSLDAVPWGDGVGDIYVGAYGIANRVALLFIMIIHGLNQGMQPIVGYNYGAKKYDRVRKALTTTIRNAIALMTIGCLISQIIPEYVAKLFVDSSKGESEHLLIAAASQALHIITMIFPLVGFQIVVVNFFQYIGKAQIAIILSITRQLLFLLPLLWILPRFFGATGVWSSMPIADSFSVILGAIMLSRQMHKMRKQI